MCNLYSMTRNREAILRLFRISDNRAAAYEPRDAIFPGYQAPVVRTAADGERELGLPHITIPSVKLEPGRGWPAFGLAEAERRADQALAARLLLEPAVDSRARNEGARHCSAVSSSRSAHAPRAAT